ncbi:hypothetical protein PQBR44_0080 (plasmid) [Pseudomonas putida UWC1]|nr:hypothetical protein PQBR44_0080 [Pseudomonas putida UWC1]
MYRMFDMTLKTPFQMITALCTCGMTPCGFHLAPSEVAL